MTARTWRWLRVRVQGLLADPESRISRALRPTRTDDAKARSPHVP